MLPFVKALICRLISPHGFRKPRMYKTCAERESKFDSSCATRPLACTGWARQAMRWTYPSMTRCLLICAYMAFPIFPSLVFPWFLDECLSHCNLLRLPSTIACNLHLLQRLVATFSMDFSLLKFEECWIFFTSRNSRHARSLATNQLKMQWIAVLLNFYI